MSRKNEHLIDNLIHEGFSALAILIYRNRWPFIVGPILLSIVLGVGMLRIPFLTTGFQFVDRIYETSILKVNFSFKNFPKIYFPIRSTQITHCSSTRPIRPNGKPTCQT